MATAVTRPLRLIQPSRRQPRPLLWEVLSETVDHSVSVGRDVPLNFTVDSWLGALTEV